MWAIRQFPDKIEYTPEGEDRPTYQVEMFGYLQIESSPSGGSITLMVFREKVFWVQKEIRPIEFLPVEEFEKRYSKFKLVERGENCPLTMEREHTD